MSYEREHADRLERYEAHRQTVDRLRELLAPLHTLTFAELEEDALYPRSGASYGSHPQRRAVRMCYRAAREFGGTPSLAEAYRTLAGEPTGYRLSIPASTLWPEPRGRSASAIEEHFTPGCGYKSTAKAWQRYRQQFDEEFHFARDVL